MTARDYPPFHPSWDGMTHREHADTLGRHDEATPEDRYGPGDPPLTGRGRPAVAPCPVCLKHYGHYDERHQGGM